MKKVAVIGAGHVGASTAYYVARQNIAEVVLVDIIPGMPQSKGLDFSYAGTAHRYYSSVTGTNDYADMKGSDVVVLTAGIARKPGMDRMDLLKTNVSIARQASQAIKKYCPDAMVIAVSNPLDVIAMACLRETGFSPSRVVGMAGILDSARFCYFIAEALQVSPSDVIAMVLGGHGDTMVPLPRYTSVSGIPLPELLDEVTTEKLVERTRKGGAEIVNYLKSGSAFYAPAAAAAKMVRSILRKERTLSPISVYLQGEYGIQGVFLGVPVTLGPQGVEKVHVLPLEEDELNALQLSAAAVQKGVETLDEIWE